MRRLSQARTTRAANDRQSVAPTTQRYGANLCLAGLGGANLSEATLPHFQIVPERGAFVAWKKTSKGVIRIRIPRDAQRTSNLIGRKCRASHVIVLGVPGVGGRLKLRHGESGVG